MNGKETPEERARDYFKKGYNCAQSVFCAFKDRIKLDESTMKKISSSFGGGMGRLREVCGAVTGMFMVIGIIYGYEDPMDRKAKAEHYKRIQHLAREFEKENNSIICRELLQLDIKRESPLPDKRTAQYYKKRPCADLVAYAAKITEEYINQYEKKKEDYNAYSSCK